MDTPLVSVIVTTYNRSGLLRETIDSVLSQTYGNLELIIVDDGSTDDTNDVVRSYSDYRLSYIRIPNWGGPAKPRNVGMEKAKGQYIAFCDDDDLWKEDKLETQLPHFSDSGIVGVGAGILKIGDLKFHRQKRAKEDLTLGFDGLLQKQPAALSSLVIRNLGINFDESESFKFVEDYDFQLAMALKTGGNIKILSKPLVYYRLHERNDSKELSNAENGFNVIRKYEDVLPASTVHLWLSRRYFTLGLKSLRLGNFERAKFYFANSYRRDVGRAKYISLFMLFCIRFSGKLTSLMLSAYYRCRRMVRQTPNFL